jgi:hypothetical protein
MSVHVPGRPNFPVLIFLFLICSGAMAQSKRGAGPASILEPADLARFAWVLSPGGGPVAATEASQQGQESEAKAINIWTVADPWWGPMRAGKPWRSYFPDDSVPASLATAAKSMGYGLKVRGVSSRDFASAFFHAFEAHQPPDILVFMDQGDFEGDSSPQDSLTEITRDPKVEASLIEATESLRALGGAGREYLISGSPNYLAARALALRPPECNGDAPWPDSPGLSDFALKAATAYLEGSPSIKNFEDPDRLHTDVLNPAGRRLEAIQPCGAWGNDRLVFVQMTASYTAPKAIGWVRLLMVLRKEHDAWSLLVASTDYLTNTTLVCHLPALARLIGRLGTSSRATDPPTLLDPQDGEFPLPPEGMRFGDFSWYPSTSDTEVAEFAEFAYNGDSRLVGIFFSGKMPPTERLSAGRLRTVPGMWKWRVWSISDSGTVSLSETRSFTE